MYGGIWGGLIPVLVLMGGLVWISLAPVFADSAWKPNAKAFWIAGWFAIVVGLFLARTKTEYCRSIIRGLGDKNGIVIVTAWIFAGVFGKLMAGGGWSKACSGLAPKPAPKALFLLSLPF